VRKLRERTILLARVRAVDAGEVRRERQRNHREKQHDEELVHQNRK
jgi:hypothetical protein